MVLKIVYPVVAAGYFRFILVYPLHCSKFMNTKQKLRAAYKVFDWNLNFSGASVLLLIFFLGGFIFSSLDGKSNRVAQGMSGFSLFLVGLSMQVERTTDKIIDDLIEISATEK